MTKEDPELDALEAAYKTLRQLDHDARSRVLNWLVLRFSADERAPRSTQELAQEARRILERQFGVDPKVALSKDGRWRPDRQRWEAAMTKEDEARLASMTACKDMWLEAATQWEEAAHRLTARVAALEAREAKLIEAGDWMADQHPCCSGAWVERLEAAIRARVETPIGAVVEGVLDRRAGLMQRLAAGPAEPAPVAPGEVKP